MICWLDCLSTKLFGVISVLLRAGPARSGFIRWLTAVLQHTLFWGPVHMKFWAANKESLNPDLESPGWADLISETEMGRQSETEMQNGPACHVGLKFIQGMQSKKTVLLKNHCKQITEKNSHFRNKTVHFHSQRMGLKNENVASQIVCCS